MTPAFIHSPESIGILRRHLAGALLLGTSLAVNPLIPFLARNHLHAGYVATLLLTAAIPVMQLFSIFWNHLYVRIAPTRYVGLLALLYCVPNALIGLCDDVRLVLPLFFITALGNAGQSPLNGDLLRSCYAPSIRGRVFGLVMAAQFLAAVLTGLAIAAWSLAAPRSHTFYLPLFAALQIVGLMLIAGVTRTRLFGERLRPVPPRSAGLLGPLRHMRRALAQDRDFAAYEIAFMAYGIGWMICTALLPLLATDRLHLSESQYAFTTTVLLQLAILLLFFPFGRLVDQLGPYRLARASFVWLTIYPLGLIVTQRAGSLGLFTLLYAIGMCGVQLTWTLGPVALAADAAQASEYLAIHTTLVGVRGIIAQGLGIWLYQRFESFTPPLVIAALSFAWAAWRMRSLVARRAWPPPPAPTTDASPG